MLVTLLEVMKRRTTILKGTDVGIPNSVVNNDGICIVMLYW